MNINLHSTNRAGQMSVAAVSPSESTRSPEKSGAGVFSPISSDSSKVRESPELLNRLPDVAGNGLVGGMGTVELSLSNGGFTIVDAVDGAFLEGLTIYRNHKGYATISVNGGAVGLHRIISGLHPTLEVDHINRDKLDNRRDNLRYATHAQNRMNMAPMTGSGYKRVSFHQAMGKYQVMVNRQYVGLYDDPIEAAKASDAVAYELFGEFAYLNFPEDYPKPKSNIDWPKGSYVTYAMASLKTGPKRINAKPKKYERLNWTQIRAIRRNHQRAAEYMHGGHC